MLHDDKKELSKLRIENAKVLLNTAKALIDLGDYKSVANRSYYAIFNAMRAELAIYDKDYKKHSAVISVFRKNILKTEILDKSLSDIITSLVRVRENSDYNDHYVISKEEVITQVKNAELFVDKIEKHLSK